MQGPKAAPQGIGGQEHLEKLKSLLAVCNWPEGPAAPGSQSWQRDSGLATTLRSEMASEKLAMGPPCSVIPSKMSEAHGAGATVPGRKKRQREEAGHLGIGTCQQF